MTTATIRPFGTCVLGAVDCITLTNDAGITVELITLGATIANVMVPDKNGTPVDISLGYDTPQAYLDAPAYAGGCIGRYANRIGNSTFILEGETLHVTPNQNGVHHLHGGAFGYDKRLWTAICNDDGSATFHLTDQDGTEGYRGTVEVDVTFTLTAHQLHITYRAQTDTTTVVNLTHHPYFNLDGHDAGTVATHTLQLDAPFYTPADDAGITTGEISTVTGTPLDYTACKAVGLAIADHSLTVTRGLDHNFVLGAHKASDFVATISSANSGITLAFASSLPCIQVYTGGFFGNQTGKGGALYHNHSGMALEPQFPPNSVNFPHFPSPVLQAGDVYNHTITYGFGVVK
ncbi:aldose epimerase family protein [Bengtsoniella intestinalis]|uniref:aldose epimerase family protein n=1 Tax=Bengtsoniella intestinalis TaxID=3073143 RepID=UPI00391F49F8